MTSQTVSCDVSDVVDGTQGEVKNVKCLVQTSGPLQFTKASLESMQVYSFPVSFYVFLHLWFDVESIGGYWTFI